jgi:hypothetical protein
MNRRQIAGLTLAGALTVGGTAAAVTTAASAATPQCSAVPGPACGSWNAEVPNLPDLDVQGGAAVSGNVLIAYTRSSTDKAEDFRVEAVAVGSTNTSPGNGPATAPASAVRIRYSPLGVPSSLCLSSVNPDGHAAVQLRPCDTTPGTFNPWQTFTSSAAHGDFTAVQFTEVINGNVLTDPANNGSIGVKGNRVQIIFAHNNGFTGQLWGQNGA